MVWSWPVYSCRCARTKFHRSGRVSESEQCTFSRLTTTDPDESYLLGFAKYTFWFMHYFSHAQTTVKHSKGVSRNANGTAHAGCWWRITRHSSLSFSVSSHCHANAVHCVPPALLSCPAQYFDYYFPDLYLNVSTLYLIWPSIGYARNFAVYSCDCCHSLSSILCAS